MSEIVSESLLQARLEGELPEAVLSLAWCGCQRLCVVAADGTVASFDVAAAQERKRVSVGSLGCVCARGDPQGELLACGLQEPRLVVLDSESLTSRWEYRFSNRAWVEHLAWSHCGQFLAAASGREVVLFKRDGTLVRTYEAFPSTISGLDFRADEPELAVACNGILRTLRPEGPVPKRSFKWKAPLLCVAWSPGAKYIACGTQDGALHFWIVAKVKDFEMSGFPTKVRELSWHHSGKALAVGGGPTITIWDFRSGPPVGKKPIVIEKHQSPVSVLAFAGKGEELVSVDADGLVVLWDPVVEGERVLRQEGVNGSALAWSPDDSFVAVGFQSGRFLVLAPNDVVLG